MPSRYGALSTKPPEASLRTRTDVIGDPFNSRPYNSSVTGIVSNLASGYSLAAKERNAASNVAEPQQASANKRLPASRLARRFSRSSADASNFPRPCTYRNLYWYRFGLLSR